MITDLNQYLNGNSNGIFWDDKLCTRMNNDNCLEKYGFKVFSQNDEDGIIEEIFERIGTTNKKFIEFGVQDGIESNGHYLSLKGWSGFWIECDDEYFESIKIKFGNIIKSGHLTIAKEFITKDNINQIFEKNEQLGEIDLLSVDIDGNDYHVWSSISVVSPRVVVIEYNAKIPPSCEWIMPYCEQQRWDGSDKHGASLLSLELLGRKKGYALVGTNISGVNAFFVRNDCLNDRFIIGTSKDLYNPPRFYKKFFSGHPSKYCIKDLLEGRGQLFSGINENFIYYDSFYHQEKPDNVARWMSKTESTIYIKDELNNISVIRVYYDNPTLHMAEVEDVNIIQCTIDNKDVINFVDNKKEGVFQFHIPRANCQNDGVLELKVCIDGLWSPSSIKDGSDSRKLGIMVRSIEAIE